MINIIKMGFHESVVHQVFEGKTKTYRLRDHNFKAGNRVDFENSQTGEIFGTGEIINIEKVPISQIDLKDSAHGATYKEVEELISAFKKHYPDREVAHDTEVFIYIYKFNPIKEKPEEVSA